MDEIEQRLNMMSVHEKETEELKWRIFKLEVQLEQDIAHYCQRAEAAEARVAGLEAERDMLLTMLDTDKDTMRQGLIDCETEKQALQAEVERLTAELKACQEVYDSKD